MSKLRESNRSDLQIVSKLSSEQLKKINKLTLSKVSSEEVFVYKMLLVDDSITRNFTNYPESFQRAILSKEPKKGNWIGLPMLMGRTEDHEAMASNQVGRIFDAKLVRTPSGNIGTIGSVYIPINESNISLIDNIKAGVHREVSIGVSVEFPTCSVCGSDIRSCEHQPGSFYDESLCYVIMDGDVEGQEVSFVAVPGNINAEILADDGEYIPLTEALGKNKFIKRKEKSNMAKGLKERTRTLLKEARLLESKYREDDELDELKDDMLEEDDDELEEEDDDELEEEDDDELEEEDDDELEEEDDEDDDDKLSPTEAMHKVRVLLKKANKRQESLVRQAKTGRAFRMEVARETVRLGSLAKAIPVTSKESFRKAIAKMPLKEMKQLQKEYKRIVNSLYPNSGRSLSKESARHTPTMSVTDILKEFNK